MKMSSKHRATVVKSYASGKFIGLFVEITASDDDVVEPTVIASIPCETELQAWATADAFNYPDSNTNTWRDFIDSGWRKPDGIKRQNLDF